jgi:hypothetical protein
MRHLFGVATLLLALAVADAQPMPSREMARGTGVPVTCERRAVAAAVARFTALVEAGRYAETASLWLPKRRLPTPAFFAILGRGIRAERGPDVPAAVRRWVADGGRHLELILVDPRVNERQPANYGLTFAWFANSPGFALLGEGKGVWDCEKRRIAMFVGGERRVVSEADAREALSGRCGSRRRPVIRLYGQDVILCGAARNR